MPFTFEEQHHKPYSVKTENENQLQTICDEAFINKNCLALIHPWKQIVSIINLFGRHYEVIG